jgi:hypothetical protein
MKNRILGNLNQSHNNYILPFLWVHGEEEPVLRNMMKTIQESGIEAVCIESRPHPDFVGPQWWHDMDIILNEARKREMKVWILDDSHFPTGYAAGRIKSDYPELKKWYLDKRIIDSIGPKRGAMFFIDSHVKENEKLVGVVAYKRSHDGSCLTEQSYVLTDRLINGRLYWDIPEGSWRIFILIQTREGGEERTADYLNPLVPEATDVLINTVYASHFDHYEKYFGNTLAGFFSDEPRFGNARRFHHSIGRSEMVLPWRDDFLNDLSESFGEDFTSLLPLLWFDDNLYCSSARVCYMNLVSRSYEENFSGRLGSWCRDHGVEYIGHVIEDNNAHARLGWGTGHFFRALWGQDMSGIDIVLNQLRPEMDYPDSSYVGGATDGEFFYYGLAKLGSSLGHLNPRHMGRTLCEIFGAFGWQCGLRDMKWMLDHMLVRGINYFVPHAFTAKEFPDPDCPPHFYGQGNNPQFRYFKGLMDYMNRLSHLLNGGVHIAPAAVLYHAEAEWGGEYMLFQKPVRELMRNQIDCDIVSGDMLCGDNRVIENRLHIHNETFQVLIVPYSEYLPATTLKDLESLIKQGLPVIFINALPTRSDSPEKISSWLDRIREFSHSLVVPLESLASFMKEKGYYDLEVSTCEPWLRYYHYKHKENDLFVFFNENTKKAITTEVILPNGNTCYRYDGMNNRLTDISSKISEGKMALHLFPGESIVLTTLPSDHSGINLLPPSPTESEFMEEQEISSPWEVLLATAQEYPDFSGWKTLDSLINLSLPEYLPDFCGTISYKTSFMLDDNNYKELYLDMGEVYETAEVYINRKSAGVCLSAPYRLNIKEWIQVGENDLEIHVTTTLARAYPDRFSITTVQDPAGLLGPVKLLYNR